MLILKYVMENVYTITDIATIKKGITEFNYISKDVREIIDNLTLQVSSPDYVKTPTFKKHVQKSDWVAVRNFKPTNLKKSDESDADKTINTIRMLINKISNGTYTAIFKDIVDIIVECDKSDDLGNHILDTLCKNSMYSNLYAKLYKLILIHIPSIADHLNKIISDYKVSLLNINHINSDENYDLFCRYNKENVDRKTTSLFLLNLMKEGVVDKKFIITIIDIIQTYINEHVHDKDSSYKIEELSEHLYILVTGAYDKEDDIGLWDNIIGNINIVCESNKNEYLGLTSKLIFRHEDILEFLEKESNE